MTAAAQRRTAAREAATKARERERKAQAEREALISPFWDAFLKECQSIIRDVNTFASPSAARVKLSADRVIGIAFETHRMQVSLPRDSMLLHFDGIERAKLAGAGAALEVRGGRLLGAKGETPQELANEVLRAFFEVAL